MSVESIPGNYIKTVQTLNTVFRWTYLAMQYILRVAYTSLAVFEDFFDSKSWIVNGTTNLRTVKQMLRALTQLAPDIALEQLSVLFQLDYYWEQKFTQQTLYFQVCDNMAGKMECTNSYRTIAGRSFVTNPFRENFWQNVVCTLKYCFVLHLYSQMQIT